ncbi:MAG: hypothetical protein U0414_01650 [Polyangiaceae bacterium]
MKPEPWIVALVACSSLMGCASAAPAPAAPITAPASYDDASAIGYASDVGGLPEEAMQSAFKSLGKDVERCIGLGYERVEALGGHVKINLTITTKGEPKDVYVSESQLGDRDTEKCIVEAARGRTWPRAVGGDGLASTQYDATPTKERSSFDAKKVQPVIEQVRALTKRCRKDSAAAFTVTAYLKADGRVQAAGLAMTSPDEDAAECIVATVKKARFGWPGKDAKLSFSL